MKNDVLLKTDFPDLKLFRRGKVRDVYDLGDALLVVSTDRISCFDVVLNDGIPDKGKILTALSVYWFGLLEDIIPNHFITASVDDYPAAVRKYSEQLRGRSMLVKKCKGFPVECIVRGYISGSGWKEYMKSQSICGISLPAGLKESDNLPRTIFTPSTKAEEGHDLNVEQAYVEKTLGRDIADKLAGSSIALYEKAAGLAKGRGIIIADTKFEFGMHKDGMILIDEVLTPDSSRFWPLELYAPGRAQPSFDKQFVRDYLESLTWDKQPPAPALPGDIVASTAEKYREAFRKITGLEYRD